jgi:hypothetical protein
MNAHIDFLKANFGLLLLLFIWAILHWSAHHAVHANLPDWLSWLLGKEGEILAAILTVIVGSKGNQRANDKPLEAPKV